MGNRELTSSGKITTSLIVNWIAWSFVYGFIWAFLGTLAINLLTNILSGVLGSIIETWLIQSIVSLLLQAVLVILIWKSSVKSSFKKKTIQQVEVSKVMRNLIIFTIIICLANGIYQYSTINNTVETTVNNQLKYYERLMSYTHNADKIAEYELQKTEAIEQIKSELYKRLTVLEIGIFVVYLGVLPLTKKDILENAV